MKISPSIKPSSINLGYFTSQSASKLLHISFKSQLVTNSMFIWIHMLILEDIISWQLHSQLQVVICKFGSGIDQHDAIIGLLFDQNELDETLFHLNCRYRCNERYVRIVPWQSLQVCNALSRLSQDTKLWSWI